MQLSAVFLANLCWTAFSALVFTFQCKQLDIYGLRFPCVTISHPGTEHINLMGSTRLQTMKTEAIYLDIDSVSSPYGYRLFFYFVCRVCSCNVRVCVCVCKFQGRVHRPLARTCYLHLHMWESEVKVTETE